MYDVIILGAGPAGLGAAIYGARAGMELAVLDRSYISGGQVLNTYDVDNYLGLPGISGSELSEKFRAHADGLGVPFLYADVLRIEDKGTHKVIYTDQGNYESKAVVIAAGASHALLGVEGEKEFAGRGVSYCATCDGAFFRKKTAAVIGGGDVAVEDAILLAGICEKVYLIHRRDSLRAAKSLQNKLFSLKNVELIWDTEVEKIVGEDVVKAIAVINKKTGEKKQIEAEGVFIAVGIIPNTLFCKDLVEMDDKGYILADETGKTSAEGIFAAGDIRKKPLRQIITAVADGANAIWAVQNYFLEN